MSCGHCEKTEGELVGHISHYFDKAGVAVLDLSSVLKVGDTIRIVGGETDFQQVVASLEVEHQKIPQAKKGDSVGMKVDQKVREGYHVYKL